MRFEDILPGTHIGGLHGSSVAEIVSVSHFGQDALNLVYRAEGKVYERLLLRGEESSLTAEADGRTFGFDADGQLVRIASESYRIRLAHLFDPYLAVSASDIEALPHQITAVH